MMLTPDQETQLRAIKGPHDQVALMAMADHLQETDNPLHVVFARAHKWATANRKTLEYPYLALSGSGVFGLAPSADPHGPRRPTELFWNGKSGSNDVTAELGHLYQPATKSFHPGVGIRHGTNRAAHFVAPVTKAEMARIREHLKPYHLEPRENSPHDPVEATEPPPEQLARPEETDREVLGNALANATQKAHQPHGTVYVSSSVREGSTFNHAVSEFLKGPHKNLLEDATRMGGAAVPALGTWTDGAEEVATVDTSPEHTRRIGALLALKHKQKAIALFHPGEGEGEQHILEFHQPVGLEDLYKTLLHSGIEYSTFLPNEENPTKIEGLHVLSNAGDGTHEKLTRAFGRLARHVVNKGTVEIPAAPTREEAARMFKGMLSTDQ